MTLGQDDGMGFELHPVLAYPGEGTFPLAVIEGGFHDLLREAGRHVFGRIENLRRVAVDFLGIVAVQPAGAFVPGNDLSFQVAADNGVFGGCLQDIPQEVIHQYGIAYDSVSMDFF